MSIDLSLDDGQAGIASTLARFCRERCPPEAVKAWGGALPDGLWREVAQLGVLALATPEGEGGACEIVAALETLGASAFPGPFAATYLATRLLPRDERVAVAEGRAIVAVGRPPLLAYAPEASFFVEIEGDAAHRLRPRGVVERVETLGGEPWGRVECERVESFPDPGFALSLHRIAGAAYLVGAADALVRTASSHAMARRQFGQAIGQFQAVAHPLADCHIRLQAARLLVRSAACQLDGFEAGADLEARTAQYSARRAAREAAHVCHQVFGAVGITLEGPAFHLSRRIMQLAGSGSGPAYAAEAEMSYAGRTRRGMQKGTHT